MYEQKQSIAGLVADRLGVAADDVWTAMEYPPDPQLGDLALPCFRFAKTLRKAPPAIAADAAEALRQSGLFARVDVAGGYVNVTLRRGPVAAGVIDQAQRDVAALFSRRRHTGRRAAVDYSSPNIAKPFGVGHLRSTMIGQSICRLLAADGFEVIGINHLGDWGTQFGKNIVAYLKWGDEETVRRDPVKELFRLYVRFHEEAKDKPELEDEARAWFKRLEDGDEEATRLWKWFISESLKTFEQTYRRLGVRFDHYLGESFYNDKMDAVVEELRQRGLLTESEGAEVVDLSAWNMPPCIIRKSDGATIYATRDLAAALYRHDVLGATDLIYVVGAEQKLHFAQVFKVLELMGRDWAARCHHIAFGMMKYNGERLSTRRGKVVYLEEVLERAVQEARAIIEEKNPGLPDKDRVAEAVGIGAVVFNDLKNNRLHDVDFRWEDVLNFDGETGPYVQYTHARACSVLRRAEAEGMPVGSPPVLADEALADSEWQLVHQLAQSNECLERAVDGFDPSVIARHVLDVCHAFNRFYHDAPILGAKDDLRAFRLALTDATRRVLAHGLYLLGLEAPEAM
ncbi:MAG: arginine--tRNA ligase [Alicyclobacillus macrosporangiidus]|uniref:arginine--tRNA ligase n=1 Tax=Alicyclobacillus macrosporangiidus TaxID=392015 RepID=UPI0026ECEABF|nr:arginine--tRNA ligase [Alicyclobacillus macrosporangiidus]MCL6597230.1 arginine--tRNA ligase [Alicyclobacillus macrosporangiidus]